MHYSRPTPLHHLPDYLPNHRSACQHDGVRHHGSARQRSDSWHRHYQMNLTGRQTHLMRQTTRDNRPPCLPTDYLRSRSTLLDYLQPSTLTQRLQNHPLWRRENYCRLTHLLASESYLDEH